MTATFRRYLLTGRGTATELPPSPSSMADTLDHIHGMRTALAELGYDPDTVQHPTAEQARRWPGVDVMVHTSVTLAEAWKAGALVRLTMRGADSPSRCATASGPGWDHPCPEHPVGALLAGTDPGCSP